MNLSKIKKAITHIVLIIFSLSVIIPFILIILNSLKTDTESLIFNLSLPEVPQFSNYVVVFEKANVPQAMFNGLVISICSVII